MSMRGTGGIDDLAAYGRCEMCGEVRAVHTYVGTDGVPSMDLVCPNRDCPSNAAPSRNATKENET